MVGGRESTGIEEKIGENDGREGEEGPWEESRNFKLNQSSTPSSSSS